MKNSIRTKLLSCIFVIICLVLVIAGFMVDTLWATSDNIYKSLLLVIMSTGASIFGAAAAWEVICKRSFAKEILNLGGVTDNYIESGIEHIYTKFKDVNWQNELKDVKEFTVFLSYGYTWRNQNRQILETLGHKYGFTVILPDYHDTELVDELDRRFGYGKYSNPGDKKTSMADQIRSAAKDFLSMGGKVKLFNGTICSTYYLYDIKCLYAPFKHDKKKIDVPAIRCSSGMFYDFCIKDMTAILEASREWSQENDK
ncbi:hypothetical protein C8E03_102150 [Lachnotalea glycerini]|uniref:Uncharacterized protein n=1 Tax=Lachnotalea glycerini TaxID=1763509 RepID=A0A318EV48_9FIRM|nr:hypothetical protein [Lachnotalea glycerini]PXV93382.1 hypothetical protein C8E03_102150 [Lachnotalea glycerini]